MTVKWMDGTEEATSEVDDGYFRYEVEQWIKYCELKKITSAQFLGLLSREASGNPFRKAFAEKLHEAAGAKWGEKAK